MRLFFLVITLFFGIQSNYAQFSASMDSIIRLGFVKIEQQKYDEAVREFNKVLGIHPNNIQALGGKISAYISAERLRDAQKLIDQSLKKNAGEPEFIFWRGVLSNSQKQYKKAIEDFDATINLNPKSNILVSRIYQNKAISLSNLNQTDEAFENLEKAIKTNPNNIGAYNVRGLIYYRSENYQDAMVDFTKIIEIDPTNAVAFYNIAMTYFRMRDKKNACVLFHKACEHGNRNACQMIIMECQ